MRSPSPDRSGGPASVVRWSLSYLPVVLTAAGGMTLTILLFASAGQLQTGQIQAEVDRRVENHLRALQYRISSHAESLFALRNVFRYSPHVSHEKFVEAAQEILRRQSGIQAFKWVPRVPASQRTALEAAAQSEGRSGFRITEFGEGRTLVPAASRPVYFPLHYIEPVGNFGKLIGWDIASDPLRLGWLMEACDTGEPSVSERIVLSQGPNPQASVTAIVPVFHAGAEPLTPEARRAELVGFVLGLFRIGDGVESSLEKIPFGGLDLLVVDNSATGTNRFLYYHPGEPRPNGGPIPTEREFRATAQRVEKMAMSARREWLLLFRPTPAFLASLHNRQPAFVLGGGLAMTLLLAAYLLAARRRSQFIEALVEDRTAALLQTNERLEDEIRVRGRAEAEWRGSEERLRTLIEVSPDAILVTRDERVAFVNEAALRLFGARVPAQLIGRTPYELVVPEFHEVIAERRWRVAELGVAAPIMEQKFVRLDGRVVDVEVAAAPFKDRDGAGILSVLRDITERKQAEEERQRLNSKIHEAAKLESLGVMAGGIAHDFNNILTGILCNACLAKSQVPADSAAHQHLDHVESASLRAAELCKQMLACSGRGQFAVQKLNLTSAAQETLELLRPSLNPKISLHFLPSVPLPPVLADAAQIRQVITALVINAAEAISDNLGAITISTGAGQAGSSDWAGAVLSPDLPEGEYVFLEVADTGCGMSQEMIGRIFDPFFTTKFTGRGLGLAAVLGIVRGHRGALKVTSRPGRGSTFRMLLPAVPAPRESGVTATQLAFSEWQGTGAILVVDDEEPVRRAVAESLRRLGFDAVVAKDGWEAVKLFERAPDEFVAVLLDLTMPQLDGSRTFQELRRIRTDVQVLLMSGFAQQDAMARFAGKGLAGFLQKPFQLETLAHLLRTVSAGHGTTSAGASLNEDRHPRA